MQTDQLIEQLVAEHARRKPFPSQGKLFALWVTVSILLVFFIARFMLTFRSDWHTMFEQVAYWPLIACLLGLGLTSSSVALGACYPGTWPKAGMVLATKILWLGSLLAVSAFYIYGSNDWDVGINFPVGVECSACVFLLSIVPSIIGFLIARKLAPTDKLTVGRQIMMAVSAFAVAGLMLDCPSQNVFHLLVYHFGTALVLSFMAGYAARKIMRW